MRLGLVRDVLPHARGLAAVDLDDCRDARPAGRRLRLAARRACSRRREARAPRRNPRSTYSEHMRRALLVTSLAAAALAVPAAAGLPRAGTLVPGRSLGGIRLGETQHAVRAALGRKLRRLQRLRAADVVLHVQALRRARARRRVRPPARRGRLHALAAEGLARDERPPPRRNAAPGAQPRRPPPHDHVQRLRRARRRPARLAHGVLPLQRLALGIRAVPPHTGAPADDRARATSKPRRSGSTASRTARRSSPRARSTSASAPASTSRRSAFSAAAPSSSAARTTRSRRSTRTRSRAASSRTPPATTRRPSRSRRSSSARARRS